MATLTWDQTGQRMYETGVDHGVLFQVDEAGEYVDGVAWNGLTTVTESPSGAEASPQYADNIKYLNLISVENFGCTIEAYYYPPEFEENDGSASPTAGVSVGQQPRKPFGFCYRTQKGNDTQGNNYGYKLHLVWGCLAAPSEKAYATVNDSPEAITFSWEFSTTPVPVTGLKPTALLVIDSRKVANDDLAALEAILYGSEGDDPRLPTPDEVLDVFGTGLTGVNLAMAANQPTFNAGTGVITLPNVTGVQWQVNGADAAPGAQPAIDADSTAEVTAREAEGYNLQGDTTWTFYRPA